MLKLKVLPTYERKNTKGEFIVQLNPKIYAELKGIKVEDYVMIGKEHGNRIFWASALLHKIDEGSPKIK